MEFSLDIIACSNHCRHCEVSSGRRRGHLSRAEARAWADRVRAQAARAGVEAVIGYNNSELLDHPEWQGLLADFGEERLPRGLPTNGRRIAREPEVLEELRARGVEWLQLTLGGGTAETHDRFTRRRGSFDDLCRAATLAQEAGLHVAWIYVAYRPVSELVRMSEVAAAISGPYQQEQYAHKGGVDQSLFLVKPQGGGRHLEGARPTRAELEALPAHLGPRRVNTSYGAGGETEGELVRALCGGGRKIGCLENEWGGGCDHYVIYRNGDVYPYCHERHSDYRLGNVDADGFARIQEAASGESPPRALAVRRRGLPELAAAYGDRGSERLHTGCSLCRTLVARALEREWRSG